MVTRGAAVSAAFFGVGKMPALHEKVSIFCNPNRTKLSSPKARDSGCRRNTTLSGIEILALETYNHIVYAFLLIAMLKPSK